MIKEDELLFVVDENNNPLTPRTRKETHERKYWHRTAHIWIINSKQEILSHQRSNLKDKYPGFWEPFFGGHLSPEEEYLAGAIKELSEESGIRAKDNEVYFYDICKSERSKEYQGVFFLTWNGVVEQLTLEKEEVTQVHWVNIITLNNFIKNSKKEWIFPSYVEDFLLHINHKRN